MKAKVTRVNNIDAIDVLKYVNFKKHLEDEINQRSQCDEVSDYAEAYKEAVLEVVDLSCQNAYMAGQLSVLSEVTSTLLPGFRLKSKRSNGCSCKK